MESAEVVSLLEQLDDDIDELEDSLAPVLKTALSATSSKLPVLDKAKLYVLVTYAIESILFCALSATLLRFSHALTVYLKHIYG
jgi:exosome complex protein LRP1